MGAGIVYVKNLLKSIAQECRTTDEFVIMACRSQHYISNIQLPDSFRWVWLDLPSENIMCRMVWQQVGLPRLLVRYDIDLLYGATGTAPLCCPFALVLGLHNVKPFVAMPGMRNVTKEWIRRTLSGLAARRAQRVICVSNYLRALALTHFKIEPDRVNTIYHGVQEAFYRQFNPQAKNRPRKRIRSYILSVSSIAQQKNYPRLVRAFSKFIKKTHANIELWIVGGVADSRELQRIRTAMSLTGTANQVRLIGSIPHDRLPEIYWGARFFVFPSLVESFGMPLIEAMASGIPIAASQSTALPEICGDAAIFFDPEDIGQISTAMERLYIDNTLRDDLVHRGLERARYFSWQRAAQQTLVVFREALTEWKQAKQ
jgi:glycosyltransferase involved in cell wall biosynthesis